ncbi:GIP [Symbiodinium natans]|uniref:GIP protein n=1 Tax=Symbiodinium natans TaxID=878477 RepID=A0A812PS66_9DINO|nr:GIP [Symbiodinium natans]
MEMLMAAGLGAKELFSYNRENFKFDQDQRIERETLRLEMQVKRFELFREDVRDLVELTVDRMDVYHLVGALFLEFCIVLFCEGRVQASAPPFLLSLFLLSNACAFIYLLLAVWLSMHASIASHSFGVRLLTRFVRLPIPSMKQIAGLRSNLKDYEQQGVANLLRLPFQDRQEWQQVHGEREKVPETPEAEAHPTDVDKDLKEGPKIPLRRHEAPTTFGKPDVQLSGASASVGSVASVAPPSGLTSGQNLLPEMEETVIGGEDLLACSKGAQPERHVQLFRQLQSKWQCYDAYCRVCMGLGVNQILQGLSYYCICHTLVENHSPTTGYALVTLFQSTTIALAVLDLAGLRRREILAVQVVGIMPCLLTAWGVAHGHRIEGGVLDPAQTYMLSPLSFLCQVLWLELWLRVAAPHGDDQAKLPRRFRQVLFLDVFGDSSGWDPHADGNNCEDDIIEGEMFRQLGVKEEKDADEEAEEALLAAAQRAASQLTMAQCATRRWNAAPSWALSKQQSKDLEAVQDQLKNWGSTICTELERCCRLKGVTEALRNLERDFRPWSELSSEERSADPFAGCLVGPFEHDEGYRTSCYHFEIESRRTLFEDAARECPGALVLSLEAVRAIMKDLEDAARSLLEQRIMSDLRITMQRRRLQSELKAKKNKQNKRHASRNAPPPHTAAGSGVTRGQFPNLITLFKTRLHQRGEDREANAELLRSRSDSHDETMEAGAQAAQASQAVPAAQASAADRDPGRDPTLVAMAGANAQHFVPEKLPWQVLRNITRVLQVCWLWSGLMAFLKEVHIYQVDFQQHPAHERRLCEAKMTWSFEHLEVEWPHGIFFRPQGLLCPSSGLFHVASPFAVYAGVAQDESTTLRLDEVWRGRLPSIGAACAGGFAHCLLLSPAADRIEVWHPGHARAALALAGQPPWLQVTGSITRCEQLATLLPQGSLTDWCLLLAGWDGRLIPVAAVPLPDELGLGVPEPTKLQPGLDAPLQDPSKAVAALHMEQRGVLWALLSTGDVESWDLLTSHSFGRWRASFADSASFQPIAMCKDPSLGYLVLGRNVTGGGAVLVRARPEEQRASLATPV